MTMEYLLLPAVESKRKQYALCVGFKVFFRGMFYFLLFWPFINVALIPLAISAMNAQFSSGTVTSMLLNNPVLFGFGICVMLAINSYRQVLYSKSDREIGTDDRNIILFELVKLFFVLFVLFVLKYMFKNVDELSFFSIFTCFFSYLVSFFLKVKTFNYRNKGVRI